VDVLLGGKLSHSRNQLPNPSPTTVMDAGYAALTGCGRAGL